MVMVMSEYLAKANKKLSDVNAYRALTQDPRWNIEKKVKGILERDFQEGIIDQKLKEFLLVKHPVIPMLYLLPKIHKSLNKPPGCPIVSGREPRDREKATR